MCDCKTDLEARLLERFKEAEPLATDHKIDLLGYAFIFGETVTLKGCMTIEQSAKFPLKKGGSKDRKGQQKLMFTYCPFCGMKYDDELSAEQKGGAAQ